MRKVILSVNDDPDYLYHVPLTLWAWRRIGWEPILFYNGRKTTLDRFCPKVDFKQVYTLDVPGYRADTITQISRLYAACIFNRGEYLMTSDIDMLPLSDYWQSARGIQVWGADLTNYKHYPICYIGMHSENWAAVMDLRVDGRISSDYNALIKRDLDSMPEAKSEDFEKRWYVDQDLITRRLKPFHPTIINRGRYPNGLARGRVDRGEWSLNHREFIDCHMHRRIHYNEYKYKFTETMDLLKKVWPDEDFTWFVEYHNEFRKLTGQQ